VFQLSPDLHFPITGPKAPDGIVWEFGQHWNAQAEAEFAPGKVSLGRRDSDLLVFADLEDRHVMEDVFPMNHPAFLACDAFEIFLGSMADTFYHEFHITPSNSLLQLRFDTAGTRRDLKDHAVEAPLFSSRTWITGNGWRVLARIPLVPLTGSIDAPLRLSFGRYDHTPGLASPVLSSTSPHKITNFHRLEEWRTVDFAALPSVETE